MPVTKERAGPYASPSSILEVINRRRDRGLNTPINAEVLARAGIPDSLIPRTLQSLQTLDLIDEAGEPTPTFETLKLAPTPEFKTRMQEWLRKTYADVFTFVDPSEDNEVKITDAFRHYNPGGQQRRMVILFRELCAAAGLAPEKTASAKPAPAPRPRTTISVARGSTKPVAKSPASKSPSGLPPALAGLMDSLPSPQTGWTSAERDKFLETFESVLDYSIPIVKNQPAKKDDEAA